MNPLCWVVVIGLFAWFALVMDAREDREEAERAAQEDGLPEAPTVR